MNPYVYVSRTWLRDFGVQRCGYAISWPGSYSSPKNDRPWSVIRCLLGRRIGISPQWLEKRRRIDPHYPRIVQLAADSTPLSRTPYICAARMIAFATIQLELTQCVR